MVSLFLLILFVASLAILIRWRLRVAQEKLEGTRFPEMESLPDPGRHPEGILYYFYHPDCGPCRSMLPVIDSLAKQYTGRVVKLNITDYRDLTLSLGIGSTPTTVLVNNNRVIKAIIGATSYKALDAMLKLHTADLGSIQMQEKKPGGN